MTSSTALFRDEDGEPYLTLMKVGFSFCLCLYLSVRKSLFIRADEINATSSVSSPQKVRHDVVDGSFEDKDGKPKLTLMNL